MVCFQSVRRDDSKGFATDGSDGTITRVEIEILVSLVVSS